MKNVGRNYFKNEFDKYLKAEVFIVYFQLVKVEGRLRPGSFFHLGNYTKCFILLIARPLT